MGESRKCSILNALQLQQRVADALTAREKVELVATGFFPDFRDACAGRFHFTAVDQETAWRRLTYSVDCNGPRHLLQCTVERYRWPLQVRTAGCGGGIGDGAIPPTSETLPDLAIAGDDLPLDMVEVPAVPDASDDPHSPPPDGTAPEETETPDTPPVIDAPDVSEPLPDLPDDTEPLDTPSPPDMATAEVDEPDASMADDGEAIPGEDEGLIPPDTAPEDLPPVDSADSAAAEDDGDLVDDANDDDAPSNEDFGYTDAGPIEETCPTAPLCLNDTTTDTGVTDDVPMAEDLPVVAEDTAPDTDIPPTPLVSNAIPWPVDPIGGVVAVCPTAADDLVALLTTAPYAAEIGSAFFFFASLSDFQIAQWSTTGALLTDQCIPLCYVWESVDDIESFCEAEPVPPALDLQSTDAIHYEASESTPPDITAWSLVTPSGDSLSGARLMVKTIDENPTSYGLQYKDSELGCFYLFASAWCE
ncbi:MAG: hypothetical protein HY696_00160 [Deltaproteobacteria bacterium]|nr:hypothetical protein [Deltaproteobacteria bacterium]